MAAGSVTYLVFKHHKDFAYTVSLVSFKTGFILFLSRFGKKKEDKSKASKNKLEALSEEELEKIPNTSDRYEAEVGRKNLLVFFHHPKERSSTKKARKFSD